MPHRIVKGKRFFKGKGEPDIVAMPPQIVMAYARMGINGGGGLCKGCFRHFTGNKAQLIPEAFAIKYSGDISDYPLLFQAEYNFKHRFF